METFLWMIGVLCYGIFFGTDFYLAFLLEKLKKAHPSIVEATPSAGEDQQFEAEGLGSGHDSDAAAASGLGSAAVDVGDEDDEEYDESARVVDRRREGYQDVSAPQGISSSSAASGAGGAPQHHAPYRGYPDSDDEVDRTPSRMLGSTTAGLGGTQSRRGWQGIHIDKNTTARQVWHQIRRHPKMRALGFGRKDNALLMQNAILFLSAFAPFLVFVQVVAPGTMSWSRFKMPAWLGYLTLLPGLGVVAFYAMRTWRVHRVMEVSKSQWMSMMWFRLDVICIMAAIMLLGWGDWLVALCLFVIDLYLAQRLLTTERTLISTQGAEWLRREGRSGVVDIEDDEERFNQPARTLVDIAQMPVRRN